jgi:hypothetical protein
MPLLSQARRNDDENLALPLCPLLPKTNPSFYRLPEPDLISELPPSIGESENANNAAST